MGAMGERRVSRKQFCFGAAVGLAGAPLLLTSCGENLPEIERGKPIVEESKLKPNSAFTFADAETGEARVLVRLSDGEFALHSAECTHRGCTVEYKPEEGHLKCPCHGSTYDPQSGALFGGPAKKPLAEFAVRVEGGRVFSA
jgi:Rieske Fe-S protein